MCYKICACEVCQNLTLEDRTRSDQAGERTAEILQDVIDLVSDGQMCVRKKLVGKLSTYRR